MRSLLSYTLISIVILVIVFLASFFYFSHFRSAFTFPTSPNRLPPPNITQTALPVNQPKQLPPSITPTPPLDWSKIHVPAKGETAAGGLAVPVSVNDAAYGSQNKIRTFEITASGGSLSANQIIVNVNDEVGIRFTAQDADYDLSFPDFGVSQQAAKGETKLLDFQAVSSGVYTFDCSLCKSQSTQTLGGKTGQGILLVKPGL